MPLSTGILTSFLLMHMKSLFRNDINLLYIMRDNILSNLQFFYFLHVEDSFVTLMFKRYLKSSLSVFSSVISGFDTCVTFEGWPIRLRAVDKHNNCLW